MRVEDAAQSLFAGKAANRFKNDELVAEIQIGFRLVQHKELRLGAQRAGDQHHLQLAAADLVAELAAHMRDAKLLHGALAPLAIRLFRRSERTDAAAASQKDHFLHCEGEGEGFCLRYIRHLPPEAARRHVPDVLPIQKAPAGRPRQHSHHAAQQRCLADAVRPQDRQDLTALYAKRDVFQYGHSLLIAEAAVSHFKGHRQLPPVFFKSAMKMGAPVIGFIDCAGMRLQESVDALDGFGRIYAKEIEASGVIPQISAVVGNCGGGLAVVPALSDFAFMEAT